jgi:hypothetical protein
MLVVLLPKGDAEQHPRLRGLVRSSDLLPIVPRALKVAGRALPVLLEEPDLPEGKVDRGVERRYACASLAT